MIYEWRDVIVLIGFGMAIAGCIGVIVSAFVANRHVMRSMPVRRMGDE